MEDSAAEADLESCSSMHVRAEVQITIKIAWWCTSLKIKFICLFQLEHQKCEVYFFCMWWAWTVTPCAAYCMLVRCSDHYNDYCSDSDQLVRLGTSVGPRLVPVLAPLKVSPLTRVWVVSVDSGPGLQSEAGDTHVARAPGTAGCHTVSIIILNHQ